MINKIKTILAGIDGLEERTKNSDCSTEFRNGQNGAYELVKELIYQQFPELQESEDERIRKALVNFLQSPFIKENLTDEKVAPWLAYLEKQKPKVECDIAQPVEQAGTAEPDYGICDDSVPGKLSAALRRHGWYLGHVGEDQQLVEARKIEAHNEEFIRNWPFDRCSMTQEENLIMANSPQLAEQKPVARENDFVSKPAEWSEEDDVMLKRVLETYTCYEADIRSKDVLSDNDIEVLHECAEEKIWLKCRFKSLRSSWKPSEEQMEALDNARFCKSYDRSELDSLYEQLKKMM